MLRSALFILVSLVIASAQNAAAQAIRGRVFQDGSIRPLPHAAVMILSTSDGSVIADAMTDEEGRYTLRRPGPGTYDLVVQSIGYQGHRRQLVVRGEDLTVPDIRMRLESIALAALEVTATRDLRTEPSARGIPTILDGAVLAGLQRSGLNLLDAVTQHLSVGVRSVDGETCIEYRTSGSQTGSCRPVLMVVDGRVRQDALAELRERPVSSVESIEIMPPGVAIQEYASSRATNGALILWSRGRGPHVKPARGGTLDG